MTETPADDEYQMPTANEKDVCPYCGREYWSARHETRCENSESQTTTAEVFHPSVFIIEEMEARGWTRVDLAERMTAQLSVDEIAKSLLALDLYLDVGPMRANMRIDAEDFARAFGTSTEFWRNLESQWLEGQRHD